MSRCAKIGPPHPEGDTTIKKEETEYSYLIPLAEIEIKDPSTYLILLAFIWPFPLWFIKSKYSGDPYFVVRDYSNAFCYF